MGIDSVLFLQKHHNNYGKNYKKQVNKQVIMISEVNSNKMKPDNNEKMLLKGL